MSNLIEFDCLDNFTISSPTETYVVRRLSADSWSVFSSQGQPELYELNGQGVFDLVRSCNTAYEALFNDKFVSPPDCV